ncbi:hypothetical protein [Cohnella yongneupensis]|uniref:Uncharacterized protein n=1 Tax=Cohnella yongneupensis TaxID=425006 RepID=A0ABW0QZK7_9BACL
MRRKLFTNDQIIDMCNMYASGEKSRSQLAKDYDVSFAVIRDILVGFTYKSVTEQLGDEVKKAIKDQLNSKERVYERKYTREEVERLYYGVLKERKPVTLIAEEIGINGSTARAILKGRMYKEYKPNLSVEEEYMLEDLREFRHEVSGHLTEDQVRSIYKEYVETDITFLQLAQKHAVKLHNIRALLFGQSYRHIYYSLPVEERRKIDGAINRKRNVRSNITQFKLENAERDSYIFRRILTSNDTYAKIAREVGIDNSYITLLLKGLRGESAWNMLSPKELELLKRISKERSFRKEAVKIYSKTNN